MTVQSISAKSESVNRPPASLKGERRVGERRNGAALQIDSVRNGERDRRSSQLDRLPWPWHIA